MADAARIRRVAEAVVSTRRAGHQLVVVVSAMGGETDALLRLAGQVSAEPSRRHQRELDMLLTAGERITMALLAMGIREAGEEAISLTGSQAAIITDSRHTLARIKEIGAHRVRAELAKGKIVIVAGFQGVSRDREVTTLGRGGSDTTAVALAAVLGAVRCDICTDVDGVFTADPRWVPEAKHLDVVSYEEMLELAESGARVLHPRAAEIASRYQVPLRILSSFQPDGRGTLVTRKEDGMEELVVTGIASEPGHARLILRGLPAGMSTTTGILGRMADSGISIDMVGQADHSGGERQVQLTVLEDVLADARKVCQTILEDMGGESLEVQTGLARVRLVGSGMHGRPGVYSRALQALLETGIEVHGLSTSSISITLLLDGDREHDALRVLHQAFELGGCQE